MQKIPTLFLRDTVDPSRVSVEVEWWCQWVIAGIGQATEKTDGTACRMRRGVLWKRARVREGQTAPPGWCHWTDDQREVDGHGWVPVSGGRADRWHCEGWANTPGNPIQDGTYELVGPKVQGNPYGLDAHTLVRHGSIVIDDPPEPTFSAIASWLRDHPVEGIVWHHPAGLMAKAKRRDFGFPWPA